MCTDEQWRPKGPTNTIMISKYWIPQSNQTFARHTNNSFWLTPLDVPPQVTDYKFSFPRLVAACTTHVPSKLK